MSLLDKSRHSNSVKAHISMRGSHGFGLSESLNNGINLGNPFVSNN